MNLSALTHTVFNWKVTIMRINFRACYKLQWFCSDESFTPKTRRPDLIMYAINIYGGDQHVTNLRGCCQTHLWVILNKIYSNWELSFIHNIELLQVSLDQYKSKKLHQNLCLEYSLFFHIFFQVCIGNNIFSVPSKTYCNA